jgi:HPt (histidine-containing phosphotransfer) domain-containing protein
MAKDRASMIKVTAYGDHQVISQPNPLKDSLRRAGDGDLDDPIARAEAALAGLSGEFKSWMASEADRLSSAYAAIQQHGFTDTTNAELFRAAHDIKGDAVTFGYPSAAAAAESLCRIIEHAPALEKVPADLFTHHINAIQAIVRDHTKLDSVIVAGELSKQLCKVTDDYLAHVNRDRPDHIDAIQAPSIVPGESA